MDRIEHISHDLRAIVMRQWPHLASKLPPKCGDNIFGRALHGSATWY